MQVLRRGQNTVACGCVGHRIPHDLADFEAADLIDEEHRSICVGDVPLRLILRHLFIWISVLVMGDG